MIPIHAAHFDSIKTISIEDVLWVTFQNESQIPVLPHYLVDQPCCRNPDGSHGEPFSQAL